MNSARYILIGGFLGAGKTTALAALARHWTEAGQRVGAITNDHGVELVDTAVLRAQGVTTKEVAGGGFGSRFEQLADAAKALEKAGASDVILAEAVGNAADLPATVAHPLRQLHCAQGGVAPLSVLVDPLRAEQVLGLEPGGAFSEKVMDLYRRQLEEAGVIVIAKADLLDEARVERLRAKLIAEFPQARVTAIAARTGQGMEEWLKLLAVDAPEAVSARGIDDETYAEGAAALGWLNATIEFYGAKEADPQAMLATLAGHIQAALPEVEIAHFKIALRPDGGDDVALIHLTRRGGKPELSRRIDEPVETGELMFNLRAETTPEALHTAVRQAVVELVKEFPGLKTEFAHLHYFRPVKPCGPLV